MWAQAGLPIVSLSPGATEVLFALGAGDHEVGVSRHCDHPVEARLKPWDGDFNRPDVIVLTGMGPDLTVLSEYFRRGNQEALESAGLRALVLPARTPGDVIDAVLRLGRLTASEERAGDQARSEKTRRTPLRVAGAG